VYALIAAGVIFVAIWLLASEAKRSQKQLRPPHDERLEIFRTALSRLGADLPDSMLLEFKAKGLTHFENPYIAALEEWEKILTRVSNSAESYSIPSKEQSAPPEFESDEDALGLKTICDFVVEGHVPAEDGRRYVERLTRFAERLPPRAAKPGAGIRSFESILEERRKKAASD